MADQSHEIPAANIGETDLEAIAQVNPAAAAEIATLRDRMDLGEETEEEFLRLCRLLCEVGSRGSAEYLLRRNLDGEVALSVYAELFGDEKPAEFERSIRTFESQFGARLRHVATLGFLETKFASEGAMNVPGAATVLAGPFQATFGYIERDSIEVLVTAEDPSGELTDAALLIFDGERWVPEDDREVPAG
jgi:hypothetical protein